MVLKMCNFSKILALFSLCFSLGFQPDYAKAQQADDWEMQVTCERRYTRDSNLRIASLYQDQIWENCEINYENVREDGTLNTTNNSITIPGGEFSATVNMAVPRLGSELYNIFAELSAKTSPNGVFENGKFVGYCVEVDRVSRVTKAPDVRRITKLKGTYFLRCTAV